MADRLTVRSAEIIPYQVEATIFFIRGRKAEPVMVAASQPAEGTSPVRRGWGRVISAAAPFMRVARGGRPACGADVPLEDIGAG